MLAACGGSRWIRKASNVPFDCCATSASTNSPAVSVESAVKPCSTVLELVVSVSCWPPWPWMVRLVPLTETTWPRTPLTLPLLPLVGAEASAICVTLKVGVTVTVVPEMATDWPTRRSKQIGAEVALTVIGEVKVTVVLEAANVALVLTGLPVVEST